MEMEAHQCQVGCPGELTGLNIMAEQPQLDHESTAVQKHVEIVQGVIARMADNSRSCKVWCVTLVAAVLVLVARTGEPQHALIALVPTLMFLGLDAYYLALERAFRNSYNDFVCRLHGGELAQQDVYGVKPTGMGPVAVAWCLGSPSIWLFYFPVAAMVVLAWMLVIP